MNSNHGLRAAALQAFLAAGIIAWTGASFAPGKALADGPVFLRGDANADGRVSISDALHIRRWLFLQERQPSCLDAADANDDGIINIIEEVMIVGAIFLGGPPMPPPFPEVGEDPTPDDPGWGELRDMGCNSYEPVPAANTEDIVQIGEIEATPGQAVEIPIFITNDREVEAFQLVVAYDPALLTLPEGMNSPFSFKGTIFETIFGSAAEAMNKIAFKFSKPYPDLGFFVVGLMPSFIDEEINIPVGSGTLVLKLKGTVSPDAVPGTVIALDLTNGADGNGVLPPYNLLNEFTYKGIASYLSVLPKRISGRIGIVGDITLFSRGDSNGDGAVDISDPIFTLDFLYRGGPVPACPDASDANDDGRIDVSDAVATLSHLFLGTEGIAPPFPGKGGDSTPDLLPPCKR